MKSRKLLGLLLVAVLLVSITAPAFAAMKKCGFCGTTLQFIRRVDDGAPIKIYVSHNGHNDYMVIQYTIDTYFCPLCENTYRYTGSYTVVPLTCPQ